VNIYVAVSYRFCDIGKKESILKKLNIFAIFTIAILAAAAVLVIPTKADTLAGDKKESRRAEVQAPLNLAILIQDDLESRVGNELNVTREFIRDLPAGSRVMVGYITAGSLQVRQKFTDDLDKAASSLRIPRSSEAAAPFNPYVEVIEALRLFKDENKNRNVVLLISDGLDTSRGFDTTSAGQTLDLGRAIREANRRNTAIYSFYAPSVGLTSQSHTAAGYGQSSLNRLSNETGGRAFFQGATGYVTFDSYFDRLRVALNEQYAKAY
jgi:hypothetical protein